MPPCPPRTRTLDGFGLTEYTDAVKLFDEWCPGISEEIHGFADALEASTEQIAYYAMTYLLPRCSQIPLLPNMTAQNKPLLGHLGTWSLNTKEEMDGRTCNSNQIKFGTDRIAKAQALITPGLH